MATKTLDQITAATTLAAANRLYVYQGGADRAAPLDLLANPSYKYAVYKRGSDYFVQDGSDGSIVTSNSDAATAIQWALDNLTSGRDWKETVVILGSVPISARVTVSDYTVVRVVGELTVSGTNEIFDCVSTTDTDFIGGSYVLPAAGTTVTQHAITFDGATRALVTGLTISGGGGHAIAIENTSTFIKITECEIDGAGDDAISIVESNNIQVIGNTCHGGRSVSGGSSGIEIEDACYQIVVQGNICYDQQRGIQTVVDSGKAKDGNYDITISGNICYDNTAIGIVCQYNGTTGVESSNHTVVGNVCRNNGIGISLNKCNESGFFGNVVDTTTTTNGQGIVIDQTDKITVSGNVIQECKGNGLQYVGDHAVIHSNHIKNCGKDGNTNEVYGIRLKTNHNYVRCYGNILLDDQGTATMSGINTFDGDTVEIYHNHFSGLANNTGPGTNAVYEQSANGPIKIWENTNDSGDTVTFVTEAEGQTDQTSPATVAHGMVGATGSDVIVHVTPMESGVTDFYATLDATNLTITYSGGGTKKFAYSIKSKRT